VGGAESNSTVNDLWRDASYLRGEQYRDGTNLAARQSIYSYQQPFIDLPARVLDLAVASGFEDVIDVGCGRGTYLAHLARRGHQGLLTGVDMSTGMLAETREAAAGARAVAGDAGALPVRDGAADLTLAMHMLYHVDDPIVAVGELRRVTVRGGLVVVGLNGAGHLEELASACASAAAELGAPYRRGERLRLDEGERLLADQFGKVVRHDFRAELVLSRPGPLEAYVSSMITFQEVPEAQRPAFVELVVGHLFDAGRGEVRVKTHAGCLVCS